MAEEAKNQQVVFEAARDSIAGSLGGELATLQTCDDMIERLKLAVRAYGVVDGAPDANPVRYFMTHYLRLSRANLAKVRGWIRKDTFMTADDITLVLQTLSGLSAVAPPEITKRRARGSSRPAVKSAGSEALDAGVEKTNGVDLVHVRRKILDSFIGSVTHTAALVVDVGVDPSEVSDGDRMRIKNALEIICARMGIEVAFAQIKSVANAEPVTRRDMAELFRKGKP